MSDIIKLLPDSLANQIAAGEVIQRPASVVKELLENSVDAGASSVSVIIRDAGGTLIQVVDDGKGMTETDARMSLERHATSKISKADDLFAIRTMGFRGEALASIAAVSQMELKTKSTQRDVGTEIQVEASRVKAQDICAHPGGTTISVKNLFYNVPVRRKFLKSDAVEMRHIIDEFERVALANEQVEFKLYHNDQQLFHLPATILRERITAIFGKSYHDKIVPVEELTDLVGIKGFIGKPETARRTRGEQFMFVNGRFFKSSYFHSAIQQAFDGLVPSGHHPAYFIYFTVDPASIDVNIHPTKTEIKFEDERSVFAILRSTVKRSLGQYHVSPSLDFDRDETFDINPAKQHQHIPQPGITVDKNFNPFEVEKPAVRQQDWARGSSFHKQETTGWEEMYASMNKTLSAPGDTVSQIEFEHEPTADRDNTIVRQIGNRYILVQSDEGIFLLHQYRAHVRVMYESFETTLGQGNKAVQQLLFPVTLEFNAQDSVILNLVMDALNDVGFDMSALGKNAFIVRGLPANCANISIEEMIAGFIDDMREDRPTETSKLFQRVTRSLAQHTAIKSGIEMQAQEMITLFRQLMRCNQPQFDLNGKPTFMLINNQMLDKLFNA